MTFLPVICVAYCTFKERSDVPHVDAAGLHELTECDLQEEDRDSSDKYDEEVRDQEDTCRRQTVQTDKFKDCRLPGSWSFKIQSRFHKNVAKL